MSTAELYPVREQAVRDLSALVQLLAAEAIDATFRWRFPEPLAEGLPDHAVHIEVAQDHLAWHTIDRLTRWADEDAWRDFSFVSGALVLTYRWIEGGNPE